MPGISVFLITRNEEARLDRTLAALTWADQIVVVDSGSTDATEEIARRAGAQFHQREWHGYGSQKVFAEGLCRNDWVLNVDADEVVTPDLATEMQAVVRGDAGPAGYKIRILNIYPGDDRPRPFANDYNVVRFYHRSVAGYSDHPLFDRVELHGDPRQLRAPIHHYPLTSWHHFVAKENDYSTYNAGQASPRRKSGLILRLIVEMPVSFLKFYFLRRHVFGGWKGFMFALTAAFARTLRVAKMLERNERRTGFPDGFGAVRKHER